MTEVTVTTAESEQPRLWAFLVALVAAPLTVGVPALALLYLFGAMSSPPAGLLILLVFPVAATGLGAPTYLFIGGPAFWFALQHGYQIPSVAFVANLASLPFVALIIGLFGGDALAALAIFGVLGSVFAPIWGAIFSNLYKQLIRENYNV